MAIISEERQHQLNFFAPASVLSRSRTALLASLFITGFSTFVNLYVTQPLLPLFRQAFHASELLVSLTISAPVLAVALTAPFVGVLADAFGRKRVIVAAMLGLAVPSAFAATAESLNQFIAWRFLQGIFIPGIITVAIAYISEESSPETVGSTMAIYVSGTVVGGFAGRFLTGFGASHYGWRAAFVLIGILTMAGALLTFWLLPRSSKFVRYTNVRASFRSLGVHLKNLQLLATYAIGFNVLFSLVGAFTYVNFYLADKPFFLGPAALGAIFTVYLIGAVVTPLGGLALDRLGYRKTLMGAVGMVAAGMLLTLVRSVPVIILGLALGATGVFACQSAASSYVGKAAECAKSSAAGLYVTLYYLGGCAGSIVPGIFWKQTGWTGCVIIILCMQAIVCTIACSIWKH